MKLATWNVNSLNVRLPQVLDWLAANPVDALCLQELKLTDDKFPEAAFTEAGYHAVWAGQKTYNGVAILSRAPGAGMVRNIPGFEDPQQRVLALTLPSPDGDVRVVCAYCPNGQSVGSDKYEYKLAWFEGMRKWLADEIGQYPRLAVLGDYNVAPADEDVHNPEKWEGQVLVSEPERNAFRALLDLGLTDSFRLFRSPRSPSAGGITASSASAAMPACASTMCCCRRRWSSAAWPATSTRNRAATNNPRTTRR